jgi:hypothetical protein
VVTGELERELREVAEAQYEGLPQCLTKGTRQALNYPSPIQTDLGTAHNVPTNVMCRLSLFPKCLTVSHYTRKTNLIYISKKSSDVSLTNCPETQSAEQHYLRICYIELHPNRTKIVGNTDSNS